MGFKGKRMIIKGHRLGTSLFCLADLSYISIPLMPVAFSIMHLALIICMLNYTWV